MTEQKKDENILERDFTVEGGDFIHAGEVSSKIKTILKEIGINQEVVRRTAVATYEAEMNVVMYGKGGEMRITITRNEILLVLQDEGPGIADIEQAMKEGYSTATEEMREMGFGAGMGLPNIKRNADEMEIETAPGKGTKLTLRFKVKNGDS